MKRIGIALAMMCLAGSVWADKKTIGDWVLDVVAGLSEAYTGNTSGSTFGFLCGADSCSAYLDVDITCENGAKYPVLINSSSGAAYVSAECTHFGSASSVRHLIVINDRDIATTISTGSVIGFAIPMENGEFKVSRFSLNGALSATKQAVSAMEASKSKTLMDKRL